MAVFGVNSTANTLVYSVNNQNKEADEMISRDIRFTIMLPSGQYSLEIRAILTGQDYIYKTCDSVKVYVGVMPVDAIGDKDLLDASSEIPELAALLAKNGPTNVNLPALPPVKQRNDRGFVTAADKIYDASIKYSGAQGQIGLYFEISESVNPDVSPEINEITGTLFPDLEVRLPDKAQLQSTDMPVISTSAGKTFMYIQRLADDRVYNLEVLRQKLLTADDSLKWDVTPNLRVDAFLYSANKKTTLKSATVEINGKQTSLPVKPWTPACPELVLDAKTLSAALENTLKSGLQHEEIYVLNEAAKRIVTQAVKLTRMRDQQASLIVSVSPLSIDSANFLEELMITGLAKGTANSTSRSQEFGGSVFVLNLDLDKTKHDVAALRLNYAVNTKPRAKKAQVDVSECNMVRLSVQYVPKRTQTQDPM